ncbi:putative transcription antiterminator [uncultured Eubacteriales bacterium]|uniref:Putative transcription antiterminator n=1 Tax=uncultured Eubacteriales bacterium TaxID=172733 RepID=A0A212K955_9FIRM|nr:putative transcription antiterminator [uncultured Eubacteriales bacterium]
MLILKVLLERTLITTKELESITGLTNRQLMYRIDKINDLFRAKKVPLLSLKHNKGIVLSEETRAAAIQMMKQYSDEKKYYLNKDERLAFIYLALFINLDYLSLNHFTDAMKVSRSSVILDLRDLKQILEENGILIVNNRTRGYFIKGSEVEIRRQLVKFVINISSVNQDSKIFDYFIKEFKLESFEDAKETIASLMEEHNIAFIRSRMIEFIYIFIFLFNRIGANTSGEDARGVLDIPEIPVIRQLKEYSFTQDLLYNAYNLEALDADLCYISALIIGISVGEAKENTQDISLITKMVLEIMNRFQSLSGFDYTSSEKIFEQLYSHFRPAYYRLVFKLPIYNPLCDIVKEEYKEIYKLVSKTMKPFGQLYGLDIPEDEIAYLTMHFGAILLTGKEANQPKKKTALIVCSSGIGSSAILYTELKNLFPELNFLLPIELSKVSTITEAFDIIFTVDNIAEMIDLRIPVIVVSPVMTLKEKYQIKREVYLKMENLFLKQPKVSEVMKIVKKYSEVNAETALHDELASYFSQIENITAPPENALKLSDIVSEDLIRLHVAAENSEDAIRKSARALLENGKITESYIDEMVKVAKEEGPYIVITKHVALPHAKSKYGAKEIAMGIAVLEQPIRFGNKRNDPVKYVFSLSAVDHESHLQAMAELLELLENEAFYHLLDHAGDPKQIMDFIKSFE